MKSDELLESTQRALLNNLYENYNTILGYRSIGLAEFQELLLGHTIKGKFNNSTQDQNNSNLDNVVCFFKNKIIWKDSQHEILIKCQFNSDDVLGNGIGDYWASKDFATTGVWTGRRGKTNYKLDEFYVKEYNLHNIIGFYGGRDQTISNYLDNKFNKEWAQKFKDQIVKLGYDIDILP